jgi:uncharacterized protein YcfJ
MRTMIFIAAIVTAGWIGNHFDNENSRIEATNYTQNVCMGVWPDYKGAHPKCQ